MNIKGLAEAPKLDAITGHWISTDYEAMSEFSSSDDLMNWIYDTSNWTYRCLTLGSYVVDCPHRERVGYGGDSGTSMEMGMTNFLTAPLYIKWLYDWRDSQAPDGDLPHTAPSAQVAGGGPAWSGICITMPWMVYEQYGDRRVLEQSYPTMQRFLAFLETKQQDGILAPYFGVGYPNMEWSFLGDWVAPNRGQGAESRVDDNSTHFFNNSFYAHNLQLAARTAAVLGRAEDAARYAKQAEELAARLHARFLNPDGATYVNGEQPYLSMPLLFNITPGAARAVMEALRESILVKEKGHLNTGMHGTYFMLRYLTDTDNNDLIHDRLEDHVPRLGIHAGKRRHGDLGRVERRQLPHSRHADLGGHVVCSGPGGHPARPGASRVPAFPHPPGAGGRFDLCERRKGEPLRPHRVQLEAGRGPGHLQHYDPAQYDRDGDDHGGRSGVRDAGWRAAAGKPAGEGDTERGKPGGVCAGVGELHAHRSRAADGAVTRRGRRPDSHAAVLLM